MKAKYLALTLPLAVAALTSCEPSDVEKDALIASLSPEEKIQLKLNHDRFLLREFDYGSSLSEAHENALENLPSKRNEAAHYFVEQYAAYRLNQARKELIPIGRDNDRVIYNADFPEKLRAEVTAMEKEMQNQMNAQMNQSQPVDSQIKSSALQPETPVISSEPVATQIEAVIPQATASAQTNFVAGQSEQGNSAQMTYDTSLLNLIDYLKQNGDPEYIKNAHEFAIKFIIPTQDKSVQEDLKNYAEMRREQSIQDGQYQESFATWLRYEIKRVQSSATPKVVLPQKGNARG